MTAPSLSARRFIVVVIFLLGAGCGVQIALLTEQSRAPLVIALGLAFSCALWCVAHAQSHGHDLLWPARMGIFLFWPVGVPAYLTWSRGSRGLAMALVAGLAWLAVMFAAALVTSYMAYGTWFR